MGPERPTDIPKNGQGLARRLDSDMRSLLITGVIPLLFNAVLAILLLWKAKSNYVVELTQLSIILASSAVVLTGTAVVIAVLGVVGYRDILERAERKATEIAKEAAREMAASVALPEARKVAQEQVNEILKASKEEGGDAIASATASESGDKT